MASGSQGKPAPSGGGGGGGIFANGLPTIAALARSAGRLTASHFVSSSSSSSSSQKKAQQRQQQAVANGASNSNSSTNNINNNHINSQHQDLKLQQQQQQKDQAAYWAAEHAHQMNQQPDPLASRLRSVSQNQCEMVQQHQQDYATHRHQPDHDEDAFYADQLRRGQLHQRLQQQQQIQQQQHHQHQANPSEAVQQQQHRRHSANEPIGQQRSTAPAAGKPQQHVNFGQRSSQSSGRPGEEPADEDLDGESTRKKKYLTAKYGAQQMNLIKKRLKVEMWLHERLQELTSKSKALAPDELDELDIDLDQLLDLEDEPTRKQHLRKLLAPLGDLPAELVDAFICDVIEQSKLL